MDDKRCILLADTAIPMSRITNSIETPLGYSSNGANLSFKNDKPRSVAEEAAEVCSACHLFFPARVRYTEVLGCEQPSSRLSLPRRLG